MALEYFSNNATTTLDGSITNVANSLVVTSNSGFPSSAPFRIKIDDELMLVTAVAGTTFSLYRGIEGTSQVSHADDAPVSHVLTVGGLRTLADGFRDNYAATNGDIDVGRLIFSAANYGMNNTTLFECSSMFGGSFGFSPRLFFTYTMPWTFVASDDAGNYSHYTGSMTIKETGGGISFSIYSTYIAGVTATFGMTASGTTVVYPTVAMASGENWVFGMWAKYIGIFIVPSGGSSE